MPPFIFPSGNPQVRRVHSFQELISTPFGDGVNALCWERTLPGDFREVVERFGTGEGIVSLDEEILAGLDLSPAGRTAADMMLQDLQRLRDHGLSPELNCIHGYPRDEEDNAAPTHVYSFHADSATTEADTWLCTYHGASSEGVANEEARRRADIPEIRAELLALHAGKDDGDFQDYLSENCHDLHYIPLPHARPFTFGLGNLWRIAVDYPGSPVPPCIHRAPETLPGDPPRLLLIS